MSISESSLNQALSYEAVVINTSDTLQGSRWQLTDDSLSSIRDAFPMGSKTVTVKFCITNNSEEPVDIYGLYVKGWFEDSEWLASPVTPTQNAKHVELGYPEYLVDLFGHDADQWIIEPNQTIHFAETFYIDSETSPLNLEIILPKRGSSAKEENVSASLQVFS